VGSSSLLVVLRSQATHLFPLNWIVMVTKLSKPQEESQRMQNPQQPQEPDPLLNPQEEPPPKRKRQPLIRSVKHNRRVSKKVQNKSLYKRNSSQRKTQK
jgi:hypothetical protein